MQELICFWNIFNEPFNNHIQLVLVIPPLPSDLPMYLKPYNLIHHTFLSLFSSEHHAAVCDVSFSAWELIVEKQKPKDSSQLRQALPNIPLVWLSYVATIALAHVSLADP